MNDFPPIEALGEALEIAGVAPDSAREGAARVLDDIRRFGLAGFRLGERFQTRLGPVVEYVFGSTAYSIENARPQNAPNFRQSAYGVTQLNSENILFLYRVSEIAHQFIPELWLNPSEDLRGKVGAPKQHLDSLNEIWWLACWKGAFSVQPDVRLIEGSEMDIDWRLAWDFGFGSELAVNLEVKRRADIFRMVGAEFDFREIFEAGVIKDGRSKFRPSGPSEVNVLGITLLGEIDHDVQKEAAEWLKTRDDIDAILLFTRFSVRKSAFDLHVQRKAGLIDQVLNRHLSEKDLCMHARIQMPLPYTFSQLRFLP